MELPTKDRNGRISISTRRAVFAMYCEHSQWGFNDANKFKLLAKTITITALTAISCLQDNYDVMRNSPGNAVNVRARVCCTCEHVQTFKFFCFASRLYSLFRMFTRLQYNALNTCLWGQFNKSVVDYVVLFRSITGLLYSASMYPIRLRFFLPTVLRSNQCEECCIYDSVQRR